MNFIRTLPGTTYILILLGVMAAMTTLLAFRDGMIWWRAMGVGLGVAATCGVIFWTSMVVVIGLIQRAVQGPRVSKPAESSEQSVEDSMQPIPAQPTDHSLS